MRIFVPPLEIAEREGFTTEKDIFGRASLGRGLTNLLESLTDPVVLAVDGQWGSGKTTFLKMWAGELRNAGFPVVYLDAFSKDYVNDPFAAVAGEIIALADIQRKAETGIAKNFVDKAIGAGKVILRSGLKLGTKAATLGALDAADFEDVAAEFAKEASELEDKYLGELLTSQKKQQEAIEAFRAALTELPELLSDRAPGDQSPKPLIVIIDELDRCRPVFALEILEKIKHFFSVPSVHFVLGAHLKQLGNSVKVAYGADIDSHLYLQKFIHLTFHLMDSEHRVDAWHATKFVNYVIGRLEFKPIHHEIIRDSGPLILHVARSRNLSLRTLERIMSTMAVALAAHGQLNLPGGVFGGLCILKNIDPELFLRAKLGSVSYEDVRPKLALDVTAEATFSSEIEHVADLWMYFTGHALVGEDAQKNQREFRSWFGESSPRLLAWAANEVVDKLQIIDR